MSHSLLAGRGGLDELVPIGDIVIARYLHSIRNIEEHAFVHVDGAAKVYERSEYSRRVDSTVGGDDPSIGYVKLFRVDGTIGDQGWSELVSFFFRQNPLVLEYLGNDESCSA